MSSVRIQSLEASLIKNSGRCSFNVAVSIFCEFKLPTAGLSAQLHTTLDRPNSASLSAESFMWLSSKCWYSTSVLGDFLESSSDFKIWQIAVRRQKVIKAKLVFKSFKLKPKNNLNIQSRLSMRRHSKDIPNREIGGFAILCGSQEFLQQMAGQCSLLKDCEFEVTNFWPSVGEKSEISLRKLFVKTHWRVLIRWFYCCKKFQQNALN